LKHMRTLSVAIKELKQMDPNTAITAHLLRLMVKRGEIPCIVAGNRYLVDMQDLYEFKQPSGMPQEGPSGVRRIPER